MALTFPRDLFSGVRWMEQSVFDLMPVESVNRAGGSEQFMELGSPYWQGRFMSEPVDWQIRARAHAWKDSMRGGKTFFGSDPFRWYPGAYGKSALTLLRHAGGAFDGTAHLDSIAGVTATISTLATAYRFSDGDMVEIPRASNQLGLHQVLEPVTAAAGVATVTLDPPPFADSVIGSAAVRVVKARCVMVIRSGSFQAPAGVGERSIVFEAVQTLA